MILRCTWVGAASDISSATPFVTKRPPIHRPAPPLNPDTTLPPSTRLISPSPSPLFGIFFLHKRLNVFKKRMKNRTQPTEQPQTPRRPHLKILQIRLHLSDSRASLEGPVSALPPYWGRVVPRYSERCEGKGESSQSSARHARLACGNVGEPGMSPEFRPSH